MIWKYLEQNILFPKGLNWVQHRETKFELIRNSEKNELLNLLSRSETPKIPQSFVTRNVFLLKIQRKSFEKLLALAFTIVNRGDWF